MRLFGFVALLFSFQKTGLSSCFLGELKKGEIARHEIRIQSGAIVTISGKSQGAPVRLTLRAASMMPAAEGLLDSEAPHTLTVPLLDAGSYLLTLETAGENTGYEIEVRGETSATSLEPSVRDPTALLLTSWKAVSQASEAWEAAWALSDLHHVLEGFILAGDVDRQGQALYAIATGLAQAEKPRSALSYFEEALYRFRLSGNARGMGLSLAQIGNMQDWLGRKEEALANLSEARCLWELVGDRSQQSYAREKQAGVLISMAVRGHEVTQLLENAFRLADEAGHARYKGNASMLLGRLEDLRGTAQSAIENYENAIRLFKEADDPHGESRAMAGLGGVLGFLGRYEKAFEVLNAARDLSRKCGARGVEAEVLSNLGVVFSSLGERDMAIRHLKEATALFQSFDARPGTAYSLTRRGFVHLRFREYLAAFTTFRTALPQLREIKDSSAEATALTGHGIAALELGKPGEALDCLQYSLPLRRSAQDPRGEALTWHGIGHVHLRLGELDSAVIAFSNALALSRKNEDLRLEAASLAGLAQALREKDPAQAREMALQCLSVSEATRAKAGNPELRISYLESTHSFYELAIAIIMDLHARHPGTGFDQEAFALSESSRSGELTARFVQSWSRTGARSATLEQRKGLIRELGEASNSQMKLLGGPHSLQEREALSEKIRSLELQLGALGQESIAFPGLTPSWDAQNDIQTIQREILDDETALVELSLGEEASFLWVITHQKCESFVLPARESIEKLAFPLYRSLSQSRRDNRESAKGWRQRLVRTKEESSRLAQDLRSALFETPGARLQAKRIAFASDGPVQLIPPAALFAETTQVVHVPSGRYLRARRRCEAIPPGRSLFALGDPVFSAADSRLEKPQKDHRAPMRNGWVRLPLTGIEIRKVARIAQMAGMEASFVEGFDAVPEILENDAARDALILHLATHGYLNVAQPDQSGMVMSLMKRDGTERRGLLTATQLADLRISAALVVLSACDTALGRESRGEGIMGITRGFLSAGATSVLASLWKVDDEYTIAFMEDFYRRILLARTPPVEAIEETRTALGRRRPEWTHPYFSGGFVLTGDWRWPALH